MNALRKFYVLLLLTTLLLSGCELIPRMEPFVTGTPWLTFTPLPSSTPLPTATFTPTPYVAGLAGTPAAKSSTVISERNIKKLAQLNRIGQGPAPGFGLVSGWRPAGGGQYPRTLPV